MKIRTEFVHPPIPIRTHDWSAVDDDTYDGEGSPIGHGATGRIGAVCGKLRNAFQWPLALR